MSWNIKLLFCLSLFLTGHFTAMCQISGTINIYTKVTAVDYLCNFITVNSTTGFAAGDKVLLIQMQGATITQTNTINFGDITAIGDAGNYEFASVDHFVGTNVYFSKTLLRTYTVSGSVQMINVPQYSDVSIDGELTAKTWDGTTGGVIVLESSGTITLNANINASQLGFRGGEKSVTGGSCTSSANNIYTYVYPTVEAGEKGEGIAAYVSGKESGRAKQANGGGGGNSHNTGGGGGSNYGTGGRGGDKKTTGCGIAASPFGYGGVGLGTSYYSNVLNKIFLGGAGGGGQQNNGLSYNAGNGGGIVILKANALNGNGYSIQSNGGSVASDYSAAFPVVTDNGDGNSGGGAGGTVLLDVPNYTGVTTVEATGGKGGNTGYQNFEYGPGGGGGGGVLWSSSSSTSLSLNANLAAGTAGISGSGQPSYGSGTTWGAVNGTAGAALNSLSIPEGSSTSSCALPVELLSFQATAHGKYSVQLNWATATEINNAFFSIEKSTDGIHFYPLTKLSGYGNSHEVSSYGYTDEVSVYDILYYKLKQTDIDGHTVDLGIRKVYPTSSESLEITAYPNPFTHQLYVQFEGDKKEMIKSIHLVSVYGEDMNVPWRAFENGMTIHAASIPAGLYSLLIYSSTNTYTLKVIKDK